MFGYLILSTCLERGQAQDPLVWGGDMEGGAPFIFNQNGKLTGFETELANCLAEGMGKSARFQNVNWDSLTDALVRGDIDIVLNGYEYSEKRQQEVRCSLPYFVYSLRLIVSNQSEINGWGDLKKKSQNSSLVKIGVLRGSAAQFELEKRYGNSVEIVPSLSVTDVFSLMEANSPHVQATVQDSPSSQYFIRAGRYPKLKIVDHEIGQGLYVILVSPKKPELLEKINNGLRETLKTGKLKEILKKYKIWNNDQQRLDYFYSHPWPISMQEIVEEEVETAKSETVDEVSIVQLIDRILFAAWNTLALALLAMPIALLLGSLICLARLYGPKLAQLMAVFYIELLRGTPLLLQMYFWFYLIPNWAADSSWTALHWLTTLPPFVIGVFGLALNYAANEAENMRTGIQAIPSGQMEAALALGMSRWTGLRRIVLPQAYRLIIPPITSDFIALLKDTSVCSVILITELTGCYYQEKFHREISLPLAISIASVYLLLSYPFAILSRKIEKRLKEKS